ncbi:NUDIX hydrolase N-terminal domain-containing protein [Companilactobacillus sp.]|uniref:NUDIX hydrolase n=1 Tax=Companilactobacillus sp. TaxID=2767905 RepID=UPI0026057EC1|nr:NUDIX hydrolase N-terminal domain-containing protein [Companilactobacillus sp.]
MEDVNLLIQQLQAIAQSGMHYGKDVFDRERYEQLERISKKLTAQLVDNPTRENLTLFFDSDVGYVTPKVDVRAATFKDDKILLVEEKREQVWSLPGGWADIGFSPAEIADKETFEEAGINVDVKRLVGIKDMQKNPYHKHNLSYIYKLFFECEPLEDDLRGGVETSNAKYFTKEEAMNLNLSVGRNIPEDIEMLFAAHADPNWNAYFDQVDTHYNGHGLG